MKTFFTVIFLLVLGALSAQTTWSQTASAPKSSAPSSATQTSAASSNAAKIDPAKAADIRRLLEVVGTANLAKQMMEQMMKTMKPMLSSSLPPGDYRDKLIDLFIAKFQSKADPQGLIDLAIPIYDKHLSDDEVKGLIQFYQTPLGKKTLTELPQMTAELGDQGEKWGEGLGRDAMQEVLAEHPDLAAQLDAASKAAQH